MKPCFGYIRVSTQKQGEGVSLEAQKDAIQAFASRHNLTVTKWFEERQTAAKLGRPVFNQMLGQLKRGVAAGVIIHKIDRSARNLRDWALFSELPDAGIDVHIATESLDFRSRGGRLTADIQAVIAADYIRNLREETIKGLNGRLKQGLYPFRAPIGYLDNGRGKAKTPDPKKAPLIREMFDLYASGQHSLRSVQAEINRRGLRNLAGQPLTLRGVETILNNPFYTGLIVIRRTGATYEGGHDAIISTRLFQQVQDIKNGRAGPKVTKHNHLFQGLFRCGSCHGPMTPELQKGRVYYRCQRQSCPTTTIREDRLEEIIALHLGKLQLTPGGAAQIEETWLSNDTDEDTVEKASALRLQIADEERRLSRLTDLLLDETIGREDFRDRQRLSKLRIASLREQLVAVPDAATIVSQRRDFLELMKNLCLLYERALPSEKREIVENTFSNRTVVGKSVELEPYLSFEQREIAPAVFQCDPQRYRDRTSEEVPEDVRALYRLLELWKRYTPSLLETA